MILQVRDEMIEYTELLEDGKINAIGNHEMLLKENKIYQEIYSSQQEGVGL